LRIGFWAYCCTDCRSFVDAMRAATRSARWHSCGRASLTRWNRITVPVFLRVVPPSSCARAGAARSCGARVMAPVAPPNAPDSAAAGRDRENTPSCV
jgi:hypothetical protein